MLNSNDGFRVAKSALFEMLLQLCSRQSNNFQVLVVVTGSLHRRQVVCEIDVELLVAEAWRGITFCDLRQPPGSVSNFFAQFPRCRLFRWFVPINLSGGKLQEVLLHGITKLAHQQDVASRQDGYNRGPSRMLKHFANRIDPLISRDFIDNQVDNPAPVDFLAMV